MSNTFKVCFFNSGSCEFKILNNFVNRRIKTASINFNRQAMNEYSSTSTKLNYIHLFLIYIYKITILFKFCIDFKIILIHWIEEIAE